MALPGIFDFTQAPNIAGTELQVGNFSSPQLSPEVQDLVQQSFAGPREQATLGLRREAERVAARRGLELFDTPVGEPFLRQVRQQGVQFGSAEANASLGLIDQLRNFKQRQAEAREQAQFGRLGLGEQGLLNRSNLFEGGRRFDENLRFSSEQFEELLRDQAVQNELALTGIAKDLAIGLSSTGGSSLSVTSGGSGSLLQSGLGLLSTGLGGGVRP